MDRQKLDEFRALLPNCMRQDRKRLEARLGGLVRHQHAPAGSRVDAELDRCLREARESVSLRHRRHERLPQVHYPAALPITARKDDIITAIQRNRVVIVAGETGSGKTTQLPKMCLEAGYGIEAKVACTQPRRVAARSISRRIAEELQGTWGREVGCKIRFSDQSNPETYIKVMTDGMLLAETQGDRDLEEYEVIIIDEAHERSLNIDFLLGHLKLLLVRRADLKVIISSATIDTETYSKAFDHAPVIEVSGRMFPVEVRFAAIDPEAEESGEITYIDAAVQAVHALRQESARGDILVFMPGERDIRETQEDLLGQVGNSAEIVPLYGRLTAAEQERVFAASARQKIIIATNIAETSLTIPGIRYVVDTGLARISRYSPRTRTRRLPIEPISQASANQRAGRCGRVENGVCVRLYGEADYSERPRFTQPEIQRANLAEVILRMKAWRLGDIEAFPFLNPPQPEAINRGYELLQELGALDEQRNLTALGRDLARLPVDPAIGRMVLQSVRERALEEVLVIAAGLSIQDPRERPLDKPEAADQAHRQFVDPDSDFLSLLKIWHAFHDRWEQCKTQNQLRKFCRANFLSYVRMREWVDIHWQLHESLQEVLDFGGAGALDLLRGPAEPGSPARVAGVPAGKYVGVHRSILTGLLGQVARREERNLYKAPGNRQVMVFPGSGLFDRAEVKKPKGDRSASAEPRQKKPVQAEWIMAGEIVETSRLFARTLAKINPEWVLELGAHICIRKYSEPHWNRNAARVLVRERTTLLGLEIQDRHIDFGKVNPAEAKELFIRSALVEEDLEVLPPFLEHNRQVRQRLEVWRTRTHAQGLPDLEEALFAFYAARLPEVSSMHDLNRVLHERRKGDANYLYASEADLVGSHAPGLEQAGFPAQVKLAEQSVTVEYAYAPGEEHDGVTVKVPANLVPLVEPGMLDWIVPGLREEQVEYLLKELPKSLRVPLMPLPAKAKELAALLRPQDTLETLRVLVRQRYGIDIPPWKRETLPDHLRVRVAVTGRERKVVATGRDLNQLKQELEQHDTPAEQQAWTRAAQQWERYDLKNWSFGDVAERIEVTAVGKAPLFAFPGLQLEQDAVNLKLFRVREEAEAASRPAFARLVEMALQRELAWLQKELRALDKVKDLYVTLGPGQELLDTAFTNLKWHVIRVPKIVLPLHESTFASAVEQGKGVLPGAANALVERVAPILKVRQELLVSRQGYPGMRDELDALVPKRFLEFIPYERLQHVPRYLKAMQVRAGRATMNPVKDKEKAAIIQPFVGALRQHMAKPPGSEKGRAALVEARWMLEELKVSVFAQELGTPQPVSPKRLQGQLEEIAKSG